MRGRSNANVMLSRESASTPDHFITIGVDDLEASVAEHTAIECVNGALVRAAVEERGVHLLDEGRDRLAGGC